MMTAAPVVLALLVTALVVFQGDRRPDDKRSSIVLRGCVQGSELIVNTASASTESVADRYRLRVPKALVKTFKDHQGHEEEVTGSLEQSSSHAGITQKLGDKTRIRIATGTEQAGEETTVDEPVLDVTAVEHVADRCHGK